MSTFYINPAAGNDANDGLSFANAWKTITNGATEARIAPGDEIRIMESPAPTLVGTGLWTSDFNSIYNSIIDATNTTPIQITCLTNHGYANNDYVAITYVDGNTNANGIWQITNVSTNTFDLVGSTGNSTYLGGGNIININSNIIKLTSAVTKDIALTDNIGTVSSNSGNWTASANVTSSILDSGNMPGNVSLTIAAGFTTGKAAYKTITSSDFSAYQQISLFFNQTVGTLLAAGDVKICLCSDTIGNVIVDQFLVPAQSYLNANNSPFTINKGSALGSAIQSIALYVVNDTGAITVYMSDIIAVKSTSSADNLSLTSMIGKNNDEYFLPILGIKNNLVFLYTTTYGWKQWSQINRGYWGTTETVNTYKIEPFSLSVASGYAATINESGTAGNYISFSGGWNRTNMSTQTSSTYFQSNNLSEGFYFNDKSYVKISKINLSKYFNGYILTSLSNYCNISDLCVVTANDSGIDIGACINTEIGGNSKKVTFLFCQNGILTYGADIIYDIFAASCVYAIIIQTYGYDYYIENITCKNNSTMFVVTSQYVLCNTLSSENSRLNIIESNYSNIKINNLLCSNNIILGYYSYFIYLSDSEIIIDNLNISNSSFNRLLFANSLGFATINGGDISDCTFNNFIYSDSNVNFNNVIGIPVNIGDVYNKLLTFTDCVNTDLEALNYSESYINGYRASKDTSVYHGTTGTSWKIEQIRTIVNQYFPIQYPVAQIAVIANRLVTVSLWFKNSASTITGQLVCPGWQLTGTDVVATTTTSTNWQQLTITFTPTTEKVIEIFVYAYGSINDYLYISDMNITQAN